MREEEQTSVSLTHSFAPLNQAAATAVEILYSVRRPDSASRRESRSRRVGEELRQLMTGIISSLIRSWSKDLLTSG